MIAQTPDKTIDLDQPMTPSEFARWLRVSEFWVRQRLRTLPGVVRESRKTIRIYPRAYLAARIKK